MQRQYGDRLRVVSLNVGDNNGNPEGLDAIKKFASDQKIDYPLARIKYEGAKHFYQLSKQTSIPQTLLVDSQGHLRGVWVGSGPAVLNSLQQSLEKMMSGA